mgnify:CR=1 FL=1
MKNLFLAVSVLLASFAYGQDASVKKLIKLAEKGDVKSQSELPKRQRGKTLFSRCRSMA